MNYFKSITYRRETPATISARTEVGGEVNNLLLSLGFSLSYKNHIEDRDSSNAETEPHY